MTQIVSMPSDVDYSAEIAAASPNDLPLIMTTLGNIPVEALRYETEWINDPAYFMFCERWFLGDELVKSNSHAYASNPISAVGADQQTF